MLYIIKVLHKLSKLLLTLYNILLTNASWQVEFYTPDYEQYAPLTFQHPDKTVLSKINFSYFSVKTCVLCAQKNRLITYVVGTQKNRLITYVVGTQKNCLDEMVLLSTQNTCLI